MNVSLFFLADFRACEPNEKALCLNGECIQEDFICDHKFQCFDKSDEMNCRKYKTS